MCRSVQPTLTPDAYVEVGNRQQRLKRAYWLELDWGTEHLSTIAEKCERYRATFHAWQETFFPTVLFVVPDAARRGKNTRAVCAEDRPRLFEVCAHEDLLHLIQ
jgi:hypothetical protein